MITKGDALISLRPGAVWSIKGDAVEWLSPKVEPPSEKEINDKIAVLQADYDSKQYQRERVYPSIGDQLDLIYWDKINGTEKWKETIDSVKSAHPKPE